MFTPFRLLVGASGLAAAAAQALWQVKPEIVEEAHSVGLGLEGNATDYYVFLQKFPLIPILFFFHTEVLVCPRSEFSADDQKFIDDKISGMTDFAEIEESWWKSRTAGCIELGYGGAPCTSACCSVGHRAMPLNKRQAVIANANVWMKSLFIYGTGSFDGDRAYHNTCDKKCWSTWSGLSYNPLTNNCNTFTSTVLSCVFGLSEKKPHLGPSDMVTVHCKCPALDDDSALWV